MRGFKRLKNIITPLLWMILGLLIVLFIGTYYLTDKYEDNLKEWSIDRINQAVNTKIHIEGMHTSFLRTFPYLSIVINNAVVWSSGNLDKTEFGNIPTDSLFTAEKVYLQFNALDLLRSKIRIRRIYAENGKINLLVDSNGQTNYQVMRSDDLDDADKNNKSRVFELEALKLTGFGLEFNNLSKKTYSSTTLDDLFLKGKFSGNNFSLGTNADLVLHDFTRNGFRYANDYEIALRVILEMRDHEATIRKGEIVLNTIRLNTTGNIAFGSDPSLDLGMVARSINISTLLSSFPQKIRENIPLQAAGRGDLAIRVNGPITATKMPAIQSVYVLNLNQFTFQQENFRNIKLKGTYSNGSMQSPSTTEINIQKFRISDRNSIAEGSVFIRNLVQPSLNLKINGMLDAAQLFALMPIEKEIDIKGTFLPDLHFSAGLNSFSDINLSILGKADLQGKLEVRDLDLSIADFPKFNDINGKILFRDKNWYPELTLLMGESDLEIKARTDHLPELLLADNQSLQVQAVIKSNVLDLSPFIGKNPDKSEENLPPRGFFLPSFINGSLSCTIGELNIGYFLMKNATGTVDLSPGKVTISELNFETMNGRVDGSLSAIQDKNGNLNLSTRSQLRNIDIRQLFERFNNFGQENLRAEHIGGTVTGSVFFSAEFDSIPEIRNESITMDAELVVNNGELVHFEPLRKLSAFIKLDELEHIRFSTLENTVLIRNNEMIIPEMEVKSNAFNITLSGLHSFNGPFEYKLKILLSELLTGKARHTNEEFYMMEENRRASLYLSIAGTANDYKIKYDKKEALSAIKKDLKQEKNTLKTILNEEFGLFRKGNLTKTPVTTEKSGVIFEWEDDTIDASEKSGTNQRLIDKRKKRKDQVKPSSKEVDFELEWDDDDR